MDNGLELFVNNGGTLFILSQSKADGDILVRRCEGDDIVYEYQIPAGDMVMLLNLYRYTIDQDIKNEFINPGGKNKE